MQTCKDCKHYKDVGHLNWGDCCAPLPEYIYGSDNLCSSMVWHMNGDEKELAEHGKNLATECSLFERS